jgi:renalase
MMDKANPLETEFLVIGAGMTGLTAAKALREAGRAVLVLDKGRGVGGRMATRRLAGGRADHGAQFFTVRSPEFQAQVTEWLAAGVVFEWARGWSDGSLLTPQSDGHPRYAAVEGMTAVPKQLAHHLPIQLNTRLTRVTAVPSGWLAEDEQGGQYRSRALILTPPAPQSLALLAAGGVVLQPDDRRALEHIVYAPCLCGLFHVSGPVHLPAPGALQRPGHAFAWIADNQAKGISPEARLITLHAGPEWSQAMWDAPDASVLAELQGELAHFLSGETAVLATHLKRWRYAVPTTPHPERTLVGQGLPPLAFAGDAFDGPRVEGAYLSGLTAARQLMG